MLSRGWLSNLPYCQQTVMFSRGNKYSSNHNDSLVYCLNREMLSRDHLSSHIMSGYLIITHATSFKGIMFLTRPSISQSVRQSCYSCQRNSSETAQQNFVKLCSVKDILCRCTYPQEILIQFFSQSYPLFELRNLAKMKDTTKTVCQCNSSETTQQNFLKLCSNKGHNV